MTKLILVRHAEAEGNATKRFHGWYDSTLTEKGLKQAQRVAERLKDVHIDYLYSSDLKRAFCTAEYIAKQKNLDTQVLEGLREINGGEWENVPFDDLNKFWPEEAENFNDKLHLLCIPQGESTKEFQARLICSIDNIVEKHPDKTICVVTHGTAIRALLCYFYSKPLEEIVNIFWGDNTSVSIVNIEDKKFHVQVESDISHLDDELSTIKHQEWWKKYMEGKNT